MNLFVYGTLLVPAIWAAVTRLPDSVGHAATLPGHSIWKVRGAVYPGLRSDPFAPLAVPGLVHLDLPAAALRRLDAYEGSAYRRSEVYPVVSGLGTLAAATYLVPADQAAAVLSEETWTLESFVANELEDYGRRHFGFGKGGGSEDRLSIARLQRGAREKM